MKLIPHNKSVGLVFFGVLIVVAFFLFVADHAGGKTPVPTDSSGYARASDAVTSTPTPAGDTAAPHFNQVDWQNSLGEVTGTGTGATNTNVAPNFDQNSLQIVHKATKADTILYIAALKKALSRYADPKFLNEVGILIAAAKAQDPAKLSDINSLEQLHAATLSDLIDIPTPEAFVIYHLQIMNALKAIVAADEIMKDPSAASDMVLGATKAYVSDVDAVYGALGKINSFLAMQGITISNRQRIVIYLSSAK